ncbi:short-chain dehydrogenase [Paraphaeosphaeria sporulosa]
MGWVQGWRRLCPRAIRRGGHASAKSIITTTLHFHHQPSRDILSALQARQLDFFDPLTCAIHRSYSLLAPSHNRARMGALLTKNELPVEGRTVLITGGSKGLGLAAAQQLAAKGANLIIVARGQESLSTALRSVTQSARNSETQRFHSIQADVTTSKVCSRVISEATEWNDGHPPDIVWCCSGSAHPTLFADTPIEQFQTMMDSNYFSCVYMAHATLNAWLRHNPKPAITDKCGPKGPAQPARHIIFTGSFVSFYSFAGFTPYAPSKAAIRSLSDSLSQEMNLYATSRPELPRMRIHTVFPATMHTQSCADEDAVKSDLTKSLEEGDQILEPEECARRAIRGLEAGEELVATSLIIRAVMASVLGGAIRGGFWKGLANTVLGWITAMVMVFIRWEMDTKVRKWGAEHGPSGYRKE